MGAQSGMEIMLRSMGLGQALDAIKMLIEQGALDKIMKFADDVEKLQRSVDELRAQIEAMRGDHARETQGIERGDFVAGPDADDRERQRDANSDRSDIAAE